MEKLRKKLDNDFLDNIKRMKNNNKYTQEQILAYDYGNSPNLEFVQNEKLPSTINCNNDKNANGEIMNIKDVLKNKKIYEQLRHGNINFIHEKKIWGISIV